MIKLMATSLITAASLSACSITVPATALMGDGSELFTGSATGGAGGTGSIELTGQVSGTKCYGGFTYKRVNGGAGSSGYADIQCEDGRTAELKFLAEAFNKGRGTGTDNFGNPFMFTYGMTQEESAATFKAMMEATQKRQGTHPRNSIPSDTGA